VFIGLGVFSVLVLVAAAVLLLAGGDGDSGENGGVDPGGGETRAISSVGEAQTAVVDAGVGCDASEAGSGPGGAEGSAQFLRGALLSPDAPDPVEPVDGFDCDTDTGRLALFVFGEDADAAAYADLWDEHNQSCVATVGGRNWFAVVVHDMNDGAPPAVATADSVARALGGQVLEDCGGGGGDGSGGESTDDTPAQALDEPYPQTVIDNFMASCTAQGGPSAGCQCAIDRIQETVSLSDYIELEQQSLATGVLAPPFQAAADACL
jgi:hypothetical protein